MLRRFEIYDEFEFGWLLHGKVSGLSALQDLVHVTGRTRLKDEKKLRPRRHHFTGVALMIQFLPRAAVYSLFVHQEVTAKDLPEISALFAQIADKRAEHLNIARGAVA